MPQRKPFLNSEVNQGLGLKKKRLAYSICNQTIEPQAFSKETQHFPKMVDPLTSWAFFQANTIFFWAS